MTIDWDKYNEAVEALEQTGKQGARGNFEMYGNVQPIAIALITRDPTSGQPVPWTPVILPLNFTDDETKQRTIARLLTFVEATKAIALILVNEIWYTYIAPEKFRSGDFVRPADSPDRKEMVLIQVETLAGTHSFSAEITRRRDGTALLEEWREDPGLQGSMTGFIQPLPIGKA